MQLLQISYFFISTLVTTHWSFRETVLHLITLSDTHIHTHTQTHTHTCTTHTHTHTHTNKTLCWTPLDEW